MPPLSHSGPSPEAQVPSQTVESDSLGRVFQTEVPSVGSSAGSSAVQRAEFLCSERSNKCRFAEEKEGMQCDPLVAVV